MPGLTVHLVDGTYELFRQHFGQARRHADPGPRAAARGVVAGALGLLERGATHLGVASDHVIESFRNDLWPGYKTSAGMPPELLEQTPVLEDALRAFGITCWAMEEWEADDALASAAAVADADPRVDEVVILTPDKDLAQCVRDRRVVQVESRTGRVLDAAAVREKYGVPPASIPDYLALVGDSADGYPGLAGWGAKSAAAVLGRYDHLDAIPARAADWDVAGLRSAATLSTTLQAEMARALLFRRLATLELDVPVGALDDWEWKGPTDQAAGAARELGDPRLADKAERLAAQR